MAGYNLVEVIDLESSRSVCSNITNLPQAGSRQLGGVNIYRNPFLCGGGGMEIDCYAFKQGQWEPSYPLNQPRVAAAISESVFWGDSSVSHFITGGRIGNETHTSTEVLDSDGWSLKLPDLPIPISDHCMVLLNSTTVMVIGGFHNNVTSGDTYIMNSMQGDWMPGPPLNTNRIRHGCGRVRKSLNDSEFLVIVAGGYWPNVSDISSVEILDEETLTWKEGPALPFGLPDGRLVEDPAGGVILVGGRGDQSLAPIDTLYRLSHAEATKWRLMPQRLKIARKWPSAFLIPDGIIDCALANS